MAENEMVVWHHQLNGHEFESTLGVGQELDREMDREACCTSVRGVTKSQT